MSHSKYSPAEEEAKHKADKEHAELRQKQWEKDPSVFVHQDDIVIAAIKIDRGIGVFSGGHPRSDMELALTRMQYKAFSIFNQMEMAALVRSKQSSIITAPESGKIVT